ncbi:hypothetical protein, conserved [Babesia bigemina]|uniref:Uncharacterized protein n=1 Tax=Babesia bigemina TaxID=5866 RepID=A0A061D3J1_BABBI|nr:hypothetical protein, conserved [Babesia bigemina]CDR95153.1 hypothetical protein, conserved [Babesia bigemina]|eukprot:XP_012767339.1 hypothetical protein, conserved [Babesia bigemina]
MRKVDGDNGVATKPSARPPMPSSRVPTFVWMLLNISCIGALLVEGNAILTPYWRTAETIAYSYMLMGTRRQHIVGTTHFGLLNVSYDEGSLIQPWEQRLESVRAKAFTAFQFHDQDGKGTYRSIEASFCPEACKSAIMIRINAYESMIAVNKKLLLALVLGCVMGVMGIAWYVFFEESVMISAGFWVSAAALMAGTTHYWSGRMRVFWTTVLFSQQVPYPHDGLNVRYTYMVAATLVCNALLLSLSGAICAGLHTYRMKRSLQAHLRKQQEGVDPFNDPTSFNMFQQGVPSAPPAGPPQASLNPGQLFSGIGFNQAQQPNYQYQANSATGPSMWNTNLSY